MGERPVVVVGVDGSEGSRAAVGYALDDAARRGARVRVITVFEEPQYWAVAYGMSAPAPLDQVTAGMEKAAQHVVDEVRAERAERSDVPADVEAQIGSPAAVLVDQARDADLLVLGHRGHGGFASTVLGSVGLRCVLHASGPVTIVRGDAGAGGRRGAGA
jgi:nucleotide-binding universal stress UspA family protein